MSEPKRLTQEQWDAWEEYRAELRDMLDDTPLTHGQEKALEEWKIQAGIVQKSYAARRIRTASDMITYLSGSAIPADPKPEGRDMKISNAIEGSTVTIHGGTRALVAPGEPVTVMAIPCTEWDDADAVIFPSDQSVWSVYSVMPHNGAQIVSLIASDMPYPTRCVK